MKKRLGDFELIEQIDPGGYTIVWKATQHMGHGITRPAAVKVLQHWQANSDEQLDVLRKEVELLLAVGSCPNIVEVYGFGIDEEVGPWIGMELSGKSLRHWITDQPGDVDDVRAMLRDALKALTVVHHADPQILHRDIKPANIVRSRHGHWQIADFGLAKRQGVEDNMQFSTVQYAAPELLDSTLGQESPKMDLYSLGMVAYEYALGRQLYRKQFPSIFDPFATKAAESTSMDDKPKWMYWHASQAMTLPKIKELIPDFPEDLSDLIGKMLAKPLRERIGSAEDALASLGDVVTAGRPRAAGDGDVESAATAQKSNPLVLVSILLWVIAVAGGLGYYLWSKASTKPSIVVDAPVFTTDTPDVIVRGTVKDVGDNKIRIRYKGNATVGELVTPDTSGRFAATLPVGGVGRQLATILVLDGNTVLASQGFDIERSAPKSVRVKFTTNPPMPSWAIKFYENGKPNDPISVMTDQTGAGAVELAHGQFRMVIDHPRYKFFDSPDTTGDDPDRTIEIGLAALSEARLADKRERLLSEMDSLVDKAAAGDPDAIRRLEEIRKELGQLEPMSGDNAAARRVALLQELDEVMKRAAAGDPEAAKRVKEINEELRRLASSGAERSSIVGDPNAAAAREAKRAALVKEMNELLDKAAAGDPAAIARLKEIQGELAALEAEDVKAGGGDNRRLALVQEMAALADAAAKGDPAAIQRLREIRAELQQIADSKSGASGKPVVSIFQKREELIRELGEVIGRSIGGDNAAFPRMREIYLELNALEKADLTQGAIPKRRKELLAELQQTIELAAIGNADAKLRLPDIHRELATLSAIESSGGDSGKLAMAASRMMTGDPGLDLIDRGTLLGLTAEQFKAFLEINIPSGTLKVELVPHLTKVRLTGPLFSEEEYKRLMARLEPATPRLQLEVRVDAWAVCRRLEESLMKLGAEMVRVHAHLTYGDTAMFVQFKKTDKFTKDQVFVLARPFVLDRDMLRLQSL